MLRLAVLFSIFCVVGCDNGESPQDAASQEASLGYRVIERGEGRKQIVCESNSGCQWDVTCPDIGTMQMEAERGGDIEISSRCSFEAR